MFSESIRSCSQAWYDQKGTQAWGGWGQCGLGHYGGPAHICLSLSPCSVQATPATTVQWSTTNPNAFFFFTFHIFFFKQLISLINRQTWDRKRKKGCGLARIYWRCFFFLFFFSQLLFFWYHNIGYHFITKNWVERPLLANRFPDKRTHLGSVGWLEKACRIVVNVCSYMCVCCLCLCAFGCVHVCVFIVSRQEICWDVRSPVYTRVCVCV